MPRYIYGENPASQNDYFGIVIHEMPSATKEIPKPVPLLRDVYALNHTSFDKIIEFHTRVPFPKFPPRLIVFDYANERTFTDLMDARFGKSRVSKINFSAGTSGTKKMHFMGHLYALEGLLSVLQRHAKNQTKGHHLKTRIDGLE